jgi:hypothetical protein
LCRVENNAKEKGKLVKCSFLSEEQLRRNSDRGYYQSADDEPAGCRVNFLSTLLALSNAVAVISLRASPAESSIVPLSAVAIEPPVA